MVLKAVRGKILERWDLVWAAPLAVPVRDCGGGACRTRREGWSRTGPSVRLSKTEYYLADKFRVYILSRRQTKFKSKSEGPADIVPDSGISRLPWRGVRGGGWAILPAAQNWGQFRL